MDIRSVYQLPKILSLRANNYSWNKDLLPRGPINKTLHIVSGLLRLTSFT